MRTKMVVTTIDQGMLSAFNFVVNITLIKIWLPSEFGIYSIIFAAGMIGTSFLNGAALVHMSVLRPQINDSDVETRLLTTFWSSSFIIMTIYSLIFVVAIKIIWEDHDQGFSLASFFYLWTFLLRDYVRSYYFSELKAASVLYIDILFVAISAGSIIISIVVFDGLNISSLLLFLSIAAFSSSLPTIYLNKHHFALKLDKETREQYMDIWRKYGRWAIFGAISSEIQSRGYVFIIGSLFGAAALGIINAAFLLFRPVSVMIMAWGRIARPMFARYFITNAIAEAHRFAKISALNFILANIIYSLVIWATWPYIDKYLYKGLYTGIDLVVIFWGVSMFFSNTRVIFSMEAQGFRKFRELGFASATGAAVTLLGLSCFIFITDYRWSILTITIGDIVLMLLIFRILKHNPFAKTLN